MRKEGVNVNPLEISASSQFFLRRTPRAIFGKGTLEKLSQEIKALVGKEKFRVLVISDKGIEKAGLLTKVLENLRDLEVKVFTDVVPEPPIQSVKDAFQQVKDFSPDVVIAVGGGSTIDTSKVVATLFTNRKPLEDMLGIDLVENDPLPLVAIPTTAGTGAEATTNAILTDTEAKVKKAVVSEKIIPRLVILDPQLIMGLPKKLVASTGIDAISHNLEAFTSRKASLFSDTFAKEGLKLMMTSLASSYRDGDEDSRARTLLGSFLGGLALTNSGTWLTHALAYPLAGRYHLPHGVTIALFLPYVFARTLNYVKGKLQEILDYLPEEYRDSGPSGFVRWLYNLEKEMELPLNLKDIGVREDELDEMAQDAFEIKRLVDNTPGEVTLELVKAIYRDAYEGILIITE